MTRILLGVMLISTVGCVEGFDMNQYRRCIESGIRLQRLTGHPIEEMDYASNCIPPQYRNRHSLQQYRPLYTETGEPVIQLGPHIGVTERGKEVYVP